MIPGGSARRPDGRGQPRREFEHRQDIVEVGRRLYAKGCIAAADGNISVRLDAHRVLTTPSGRNKGRLSPEDLVVTDMSGRRLYGTLEPSSELEMHLAMYQERPDVCAVVHAHPPHASGFAVAGLSMDQPLLSEVVLTLGTVPLAAYGTPTTPELAEAVRPYASSDGILLANHGALTVGSDVYQAYDRMETLEHSAHIYLVARLMGTERPLSDEHVARLRLIRERLQAQAPEGECVSCRSAGAPAASTSARPAEGARPAASPVYSFTREELIELITDVVKQL
jgi:L-fuculose-phosphate aldolase